MVELRVQFSKGVPESDGLESPSYDSNACLCGACSGDRRDRYALSTARGTQDEHMAVPRWRPFGYALPLLIGQVCEPEEHCGAVVLVLHAPSVALGLRVRCALLLSLIHISEPTRRTP